MQFQSDIIGVDVERPSIVETTAKGAAFLAGLSVKIYKNMEDLKKKTNSYKIFKPQMDEIKRNELVDRWHRAAIKSKDWAKDN